MRKNIYIFDFDGVLIDSAREIAISAYRTVTKDNVVPEEFVKLFLHSKGAARNGGEMVLLAGEVLRRNGIDSSDEVPRETIESLAQDVDLLTLRDNFISTRREFIHSSLEDWKDLHVPIKQVWQLFKEFPVEDRFILTYKDLWSVKTLSEHFGVELIEEQIYSSDTRKKKYENFFDLQSSYMANKYTFIDDSPTNLLELARQPLGDIELQLLHANWGYGRRFDRLRFDQYSVRSVSEQEFLHYVSAAGFSSS